MRASPEWNRTCGRSGDSSPPGAGVATRKARAARGGGRGGTPGLEAEAGHSARGDESPGNARRPRREGEAFVTCWGAAPNELTIERLEPAPRAALRRGRALRVDFAVVAEQVAGDQHLRVPRRAAREQAFARLRGQARRELAEQRAARPVDVAFDVAGV